MNTSINTIRQYRSPVLTIFELPLPGIKNSGNISLPSLVKVSRTILVFPQKGISVMSFRSNVFVIFSVGLAVFSTPGCNGIELTSQERDREIAIDGDREDWAGRIRYLDDKNVAIGIMNDESDLYICLSSSDQRLLMQTMTGGLTLWFDTEGGKKETFGIGYPLSKPGGSDLMSPFRGRGKPGMSGDEQFIRGMQYFLSSQYEIDILGPGEDESLRIPVQNTEGIHVSADLTEFGQFVYEIKIPLKETSPTPFALDISPGETLGVGFKTGQMKMDRDRKREEGIEPGGSSGKMGRGVMGRGGVPNRKPSEPLEVWTKITLVSVNVEKKN